jgi:putative component of toxin-antitoxin plasmid stabilization module
LLLWIWRIDHGRGMWLYWWIEAESIGTMVCGGGWGAGPALRIFRPSAKLKIRPY